LFDHIILFGLAKIPVIAARTTRHVALGVACLIVSILRTTSHQAGGISGLLSQAVAGGAGCSFGEDSLPTLHLAGVNCVPGGQLGYRPLALYRLEKLPPRRQGATLALKARLCFLRRSHISYSFPTANAAHSSGATLSLS
jgi:hypothetical protein